jgi:hypothetical protein
MNERGYAELTREIELPFVPTLGMKLQLSLQDFSENPEYVKRLEQYQHLATGIITVEDLYYHIEDQIFVIHFGESVTDRAELDELVDQWIHSYGFTVTMSDQESLPWPA